MKTTASYHIAQWSLLQVDRRFRGAYINRAIALVIEVVRTSETSTIFWDTALRNKAEGC
jgi:hypothetical protein